MTKITLTSLANLQNETTAVNAINANSATIVAAIDNTLSRDGTAPNTMGASLDMNSNRVLNLPQPLSADEPIRLQDITNFQGSVIPTSVIPATPADMFLTSNGTTYVPRNIVGSDLPNPTTTSLGGTFSKPLAYGQVLGGLSNTGTPQVATNAVFTAQDPFVLTAGRLGATTPAIQVDSSAANSITGLKITGQASGNGVNIGTIGETNVPLIIDSKGNGTINFGVNSTGQIVMFQDVVTNGAHGINGQMAANTLKGNSTGSAALSTDLTYQQVTVLLNQTKWFKTISVNFNAGNADTIIQLPTPPTGYTRYSLRSTLISSASASLNPSTIGLFTAAAGGGLALIASGTATTVTATTDSTINNLQALSAVNVNAMSNLYSALTTGQLFFRVQTASTVPATASVSIEIQWLP